MKLRILSEIAVNDIIAANVELEYREFYINKRMESQFGLDSIFEGVPCKTLALKGRYDYALEAAPTFESMFLLVKAELEAQGLIVELITE